MNIGRPKRDRHPETAAVALLGATFLVVALLLGQALLALRSNELIVKSTLDAFAGFAAERVAVDLNATFASIFLDQIAAGRAAHYDWVSGENGAGELPKGRWALPEGAVPLHFSLDGDRVVPRGGALDASTEAWIAEEVGNHARDVYPRPAPYAVLRSTGPTGQRTVVYRREESYEGVSIYGFVVRFEAFGSTFEDILNDTPVLPEGFSGQVNPREILSVRLAFAQDTTTLFVQPGPRSFSPVIGEAMAAKAGRMTVHVEIDGELARTMVPGGTTRASIPLFVGLTALTLGLFAAAIALLRRATRLNRLRERFVENVSHDLRTPLAQIRMFSETLLLDRLSDPTEQRRSLEIIHQQATNLSDLVDNILHASSREPVGLRPVQTNLREVLTNTLDALAPAARTRSAQLIGDVAGAEYAEVDAAALRRILMNLVDNALKYGPPGQEVRVRLDHLRDSLDVTVEDQGPGVPKSDRARVWERFNRLDHADGTITGAGIGLAVVRDLAERHGGSVDIEEGPSQGARVVVRLATGARVAS